MNTISIKQRNLKKENYVQTQNNLEEAAFISLWNWSEKYEIAIISPYYEENMNGSKIRQNEKEGQSFSNEENKERYLDLYAFLVEQKKYGIKKVYGNYIENFDYSQVVHRTYDAFFVVNINNDKDFFNTIIKLGKWFSQELVLLKSLNKDAYLVRTKFPSIDKKILLGKFQDGMETAYKRHIRKNRKGSFVFANITTTQSFNNSGRYLMSRRAKELLKKMNNL
jgi:hypothetical protein